MRFTHAYIANACGGTLVMGDPEGVITGIAHDSREAKEGDLFFAMIGQQMDGHIFLADAVKNGCRSFVISDENALEMFREGAVKGRSGEIVMPAEDTAVILAKDTTLALGDLAKYRLGELNGGRGALVVGVTGSTGKTTTRDMTAKVLSARYKVGATEGNLNTEVGLCKCVLDFPEDTEAAVLEMGTDHPGEISTMVRIAPPHIALMTNVGVAHLEIFGTRDEIFKAKMEIASRMTEEDILVVNKGDYLDREHLTGPYRLVLTGAEEDCDGRVEDLALTARNVSFTYKDKDGETKVDLPVPGSHNAYNAALALMAGTLLGIPAEEGAKALEELTLTGSRLRYLSEGGITFIDDSYNANPASMGAALEVLSRAEGRTFAVVADMKELGPEEEEMHRTLGRRAKELGITGLFAYGPLARYMAEAAGDTACWFEDREQIAGAVVSVLEPGDTVLFKASHSMAADKVLAEVLALLKD